MKEAYSNLRQISFDEEDDYGNPCKMDLSRPWDWVFCRLEKHKNEQWVDYGVGIQANHGKILPLGNV